MTRLQKLTAVAAAAATATAVFAAGGVPGAGATSGTSTVRAALNHLTIHRGSSATIAGSVTPGLPGQVVVLQRNYGGAWHDMARTTLTRSSTFGFSVTGLGGQYVYRVVHPLQHGWHTSVSRGMTLTIQNVHTVTVAQYASASRVWDGPRIYVPAPTFQIAWHNGCVQTSGTGNGLVIDWNGDPSNGTGFEYYFGLYNPARDGVWTVDSGARDGSISVSAYCAWSLVVSYQTWS
jgi:hypothetical protein